LKKNIDLVWKKKILLLLLLSLLSSSLINLKRNIIIIEEKPYIWFEKNKKIKELGSSKFDIIIDSINIIILIIIRGADPRNLSLTRKTNPCKLGLAWPLDPRLLDLTLGLEMAARLKKIGFRNDRQTHLSWVWHDLQTQISFKI
jgi:hypothetical protein